ncbi:MAG: ankyrin repeat domain-containing protein [Burkholderiales bacterium]|nr:ankyrin repeat domain-containing protein [Burkholderiales bacterium]
MVNEPSPSERHFDFPFRTRPAGLIEAVAVLLALAARLALAVLLWFVFLQAALEVLPHAPAVLAYALGGWLNAAADTSTPPYAVVTGFVAISLLRRWRAPRRVSGTGEGWQWSDRGRSLVSWQAADVRSVLRLHPTLAWLLTAVPFCPRRFRPVSGALRGWVALRLRGRGLVLMPVEQPAALRVALRTPTYSSTRAASPTRWAATLRWAGTGGGLMVLLVPLCAVVNILLTPESQAWVSEWPARLALPRLRPGDYPELVQTMRLRDTVAAGNPAVVRAMLATLDDPNFRIAPSMLRWRECVRPLSELAELDKPPKSISQAQRAAFSTELQAVLRPFEQRAQLGRLPLPDSIEHTVGLARDGNLLPECQEHPLPYWRGEWSARGLWSKDEGGELLKPGWYAMSTLGVAVAVRLTLAAGQLEAHERHGFFDQPLLMLALDDLRWQRSREEKSRNPALESQLHEVIATLSKGEISDLKAIDSVNRSVAYLAAAAGESALMRRAVEEAGVRATQSVTVAGSTLLHAAAAAGSADDVDWLVRRGAQVNAADIEGRTPLHLAATPATARRLRELGAATDALDFQGRVPLPPPEPAASGAAAR